MAHLNEAIAADLAALTKDNDPTGLQRAALAGISADMSAAEIQRHVGRLRDAVNVREWCDANAEIDGV